MISKEPSLFAKTKFFCEKVNQLKINFFSIFMERTLRFAQKLQIIY